METAGVVGLTRDVLFSPLELKTEAQSVATKADDAGIDLSTWAVPGETKREVRARDVLRRFAVRWWKYHQIRVAESWLDSLSPPTEAYIKGVRKCIDRIDACT